jgi:hypothetical protein
MATVRTLLNQSLYLSVADREFSPIEPGGSQINAAIEILNELVEKYRDNVPYWSTTTVSTYEELQAIEAANINYIKYLTGNVVISILIPMNQLEFSRYRNIVNLQTIPYAFWLDRLNNVINVYPLPGDSANSTFELGYTPLFNLTNINEELPQSITRTFQGFLEYDLAFEMCNQYSVDWTEQKEAKRNDWKRKLMMNSQRSLDTAPKDRLNANQYPVPLLAYISGVLPN